MTRSLLRTAFCLLSAGTTFAACSGGSKMTPAPQSSASASASPSATPVANVPGGGLGGSTNIAYVAAYAAGASPVFIYNFATEAFATLPIVDSTTYSPPNGVAISADGTTLYDVRPTATNATTYETVAYLVSNTGAVAEGTVPSGPYFSDVVVPQPNGSVYVYNGPSGAPPTTVTVYAKDLKSIVSPAATATFGNAELEYSVPDPSDGNQYTTDASGNFFVTNGNTLLGSLVGVVSPSVDLSNFGESQSVVATGGSTVYIASTSTGSNAVASISVANPAAPTVNASLPIVDTNVDAVLYSKTANTIYAVTHTTNGQAVETYHLTAINPLTMTALNAIALSGAAPNLKGFAVSPDGTKLIATLPATVAGQVDVFNTSSGSLLASPSLPNDQSNASLSAQNVVTF